MTNLLHKTRHFAVAVLAIAFLFSCSLDREEPGMEDERVIAPSDSQIIQGQYIIVFNTKITGDENSKFPDNYQKAQEAVGLKTKKLLSEAKISDAELLYVYSKALNAATVKLTSGDVAKLAQKKEISYIEEDRIITFAPPCGTPKGGPCPEEPDSGGGDASNQETPYGISRVNGVTQYGGSGVAWIIDSGIDLTHEDLNVDPSRGFNAFTSGKEAESTNDLNGHGTHVAGTIAAKNNDLGVIGVAPGAVVIPVKVLDRRGSGTYSGVIAGVEYVAANGNSGDVANMSLGGPSSQALDDAVSAASSQVKFALAAGNDRADANNYSPARVNGSNIVTISAMDANDTWASFSNYGNPPIDYAAPGVSVKSTWKNGGYNTISGTSMAAPHAAGVLLLGSAKSDGTVSKDPDNNPDPIIVH